MPTRDDPDRVPEALARWLEDGRRAAVATVIQTWGSAPRREGAMLGVRDDGVFVGSVSGGCIESETITEALACIEDRRLRVLEYGVSDARAWEVGLACGGKIRVLVGQMEAAVLRRLVALRARRAPCVVATRLSDGEQALFEPHDMADPSSDLAQAAQAAYQSGRSGVSAEETVACVVFVPAPRLVIIGAVHIGARLADLAKVLGHDVQVFDPRPAFVEAWSDPDIAARLGWADTPELALDAGVALVTLTHDPKIDDLALALALRAKCGYVGALGSRKTHAARRARLAAQGLDAAMLDTIHAPVGLAIGGREAGDIALSILAQIVQVRHKGLSA